MTQITLRGQNANLILNQTGRTGPQGPQGPQGDIGPQGPAGDPGQGVASGGNTNDVLVKASSSDYDTQWTNSPTLDSIQLNLSPTTPIEEGLIRWNSTDGVVEFGTNVPDVVNQVGTEVFVRVRNNTGSLIQNGASVHINGALGNRPTVELASSTSLITSQSTIGLATHDIANNSDGYITVIGKVRDLNTSAFSDGDTVYLSGTPGVVTNVEPSMSDIYVEIGVVTRAHATQGTINVHVNNFSRLNRYVSKSGDTMTGPLVIDDPTSGVSLNITSDNSGGLNTFDSTGRINLHSYQKAQEYADDTVTLAHFGEVIRIDMEHQQAKGVIAFRENYLGAPEGPRTVAWLVAHGEANDSTPGNPLWHNHFSVELPDENGQLQTSFEFPFAPYNQANGFGIPVNQMYNRSTTLLIAANRGLVAENVAGVSKNVYFSSGTRGADANRRWGVQADATAESGTNAGTNFRINRYDDSGTFVASPFFIRRSDGQIGINQTSPSAALDVVGTTELNGNVSIPSTSSALSIGNASAQGGASLYIEKNANGVGMIFRNTTGAGNTAANIVSQSQTSTSRAFQAGLQSDSVNRLSIEHSGMIEWGAGGGSGRDTNLYRNAANVLKTDDKFDANTYAVAGSDGASGTFTTVDGKTVTVTSGLITSIV